MYDKKDGTLEKTLTVEKLENINDYFHISQDSFVLYNDVEA